MEYSFNTNYLEIITETSNTTSPVYREAAEDVDKNTNKGVAYFKNFMTSIENLADKAQVKDVRISSSKGNIKSFKGYNDIKTAISFINKNLSGIGEVKDCITVFDALENWSSLYEDGYSKDIRLIQLEYENAVFMLSTSLSTILASNMDVIANGTEIRITKKSAPTHGVIQKTMKELAAQLGNRDHKDYLEGLLKGTEVAINESVYTEGVIEVIDNTLSLIKGIFNNGAKIFKAGSSIFKTLKRTLFGIVPLIRSIMYIRYKKKADTIVSLEEQIIFIQRNIEQLNNIKTMDEDKKKVIIKKQKAVIEQYKKKADKLRAQLMETEKQATEAIKKEDPQMKNTDEDLVLESAIFMEKKITPRMKSALKANRHLSKNEIRDTRYDKMMDKFSGSMNKLATSGLDIKKEEIKKKAEKAYEIFVKNTSLPSVRLIPGANHKTDSTYSLKNTKFGGIPYWPKDMEWPTSHGKPCVCLAQLNLDKMPNLPGYPTSGILQFFIEGYDDWDVKATVVYHTDTNKEALKDVPRSTITEVDDYPPFNGVYYPKAVKQQQSMTPGEDEWSVEAAKAINEVFGTKYENLWKDVPREICDAFYDASKYSDYDGCRFGGHPYFTQNDASEGDKLLLQIDSESGIMWGDCGVANFFISPEDLAKKDFSDVRFTWDCL